MRKLPPPVDPIEPGRVVTYQAHDDQRQWLPGSKSTVRADQLKVGTVQHCTWEDGRWRIALHDGSSIGLRQILAVAEHDDTGQIIASWWTQPLWQEEEYTREAIN